MSLIESNRIVSYLANWFLSFFFHFSLCSISVSGSKQAFFNFKLCNTVSVSFVSYLMIFQNAVHFTLSYSNGSTTMEYKLLNRVKPCFYSICTCEVNDCYILYYDSFLLLLLFLVFNFFFLVFVSNKLLDILFVNMVNNYQSSL